MTEPMNAYSYGPLAGNDGMAQNSDVHSFAANAAQYSSAVAPEGYNSYGFASTAGFGYACSSPCVDGQSSATTLGADGSAGNIDLAPAGVAGPAEDTLADWEPHAEDAQESRNNSATSASPVPKSPAVKAPKSPAKPKAKSAAPKRFGRA